MLVSPLDLNILSMSATRLKVLLLQGPVGPFFSQLQDALEASGMEAWRVSFNAADRLHGRNRNVLRFAGGLRSWHNYFRDQLMSGGFNAIVLFGSERPAHRIARKLAIRMDVPVLSLEEGYIRPGYISAEFGGNNARSPLAGRLPDHNFSPSRAPEKPENTAGFRHMVAYGALHYTAREATTFGKSRELFHRKTPLIPEAFFWSRNFARRVLAGPRNFTTVQRLLEHADKKYYLVPLQVASDANLQKLSYGWTSQRLISEVSKSFAAKAPVDTRLVFKFHPMERGHHSLFRLIRETAEQNGISDRVDVVDTGSLGLMARHAAGMLTINSTSGLSAIFHGIPLLVIGQAIYAHESLATCTYGAPDFDQFWTSNKVASESLRHSYLSWIRERALKAGDFYCPEGRQMAIRSVIERLLELPLVSNNAIKLQTAS